jgi:serine/threonine protein kinase
MIGKTISHYKITEKLGQGGMGEVYLADDTKLKRQVAIKFLPEHLTKNKENIDRFEREGEAAAALNHPNIVTIYDVIEEDVDLCIVMEYVEGKSLREVINEYNLGLDEIIDIISQISEGLSKAHKAGIVHREADPPSGVIGMKSSMISAAKRYNSFIWLFRNLGLIAFTQRRNEKILFLCLAIQKFAGLSRKLMFFPIFGKRVAEEIPQKNIFFRDF